MPPPSSRMTKNAVKDFRYRPGKAEVEDEEDEIEEDEEEEEEDEQAAAKPAAPAPKASTFPSQKKLAIDLSRADQQRTIQEEAPPKADDDLDGFETASESEQEGDNGSSGDEEESSEEEDSSSDDEPKKPMLAPKFISKAQRAKQQQTAQPADTSAEDERRRKEKADEILQAQLSLDAAARAAGKKAWDDDDNIEEEVDDTDNIDPEAERAAWKLRELKRVRRDRLAIEEKEKEREEIERRRNMTAEEREAEDAEFIAAQKDGQEGRGKMAFMQKYFHKGAFFQGAEGQDEEVKAALNRDLAGARFVDETASKEVLPEYMRIRDMSKLGKKGGTKYRDLKTEDTGSWGMKGGRGKGYEGIDERFRPDGGQERDRTGANAAPVGERRRREDDGEGGRGDKRARYD